MSTTTPYKHTSSKTGKTYFLHKKPVKVPGKANEGKVGELFYFAKEVNAEFATDLPDNKIVVEGSNGFPIARKKEKSVAA